jgi:micrococcal nuclease
MRLFTGLLLLLFPLSFLGLSKADSNTQLVSCFDGDTCRFRVNGEVINARFSGIDAPEIDQPYGVESRNATLALLNSQPISLKCYGSALGNRKACDVFAGKIDVQSKLVEMGLAMDYPQYSNKRYASIQKLAKAQGKGIWKSNTTISPYCWRWMGTPSCESDKLYQP